MTFLFVWILLTQPSDRVICSLWISNSPTVETMRAACPWPLPDVDKLQMQAIDLLSGKVACGRPASELPELRCELHPLDAYRLDIVYPDFQNYICAIKVPHDGQPSTDEIASQCPQAPADYVLTFSGQEEQAPAAAGCALPGLTPVDITPDPTGLVTSYRLQYLAGRLLWYGIVKPDCDGWSGIDPSTGMATECGMDSALASVIAWQNALNDKLWEAGLTHSVPPMVMKRILLQESQLWPLAVGRDGERGMMQLTDAGADLVLRSSRDIYFTYCDRSIYPSRCATHTYDTLTDAERSALRAALLASLDTGQMLPVIAIHAFDANLFAQMLAGVYCAIPSPTWDRVIAAWNAGYSCVAGPEICLAGKKYVDKTETY
jgi:hypothetical protein